MFRPLVKLVILNLREKKHETRHVDVTMLEAGGLDQKRKQSPKQLLLGTQDGRGKVQSREWVDQEKQVDQEACYLFYLKPFTISLSLI